MYTIPRENNARVGRTYARARGRPLKTPTGQASDPASRPVQIETAGRKRPLPCGRLRRLDLPVPSGLTACPRRSGPDEPAARQVGLTGEKRFRRRRAKSPASRAERGGAAPSAIPKRKRRPRHARHAQRKRLRVAARGCGRGIAEPPPPSIGGGLSLWNAWHSKRPRPAY